MRIIDGRHAQRIARAAVCGLSLFTAWVVVATVHPARAQGTGTSDVLTGAQLNEERLLEALTPDPGGQKRSLRVKATSGSRPAAPPQPARPSASLLITFHTSSSGLTPNAKQQLDVVGAALKNARLAPYKFTVEGHADPRGDRTTNLVLSQHRAGSVRSYLIDTHGIEPDRLIPEGKGDREVLNRAVPAAPENRRVTIVTNIE
jgi:outer membrane protein OmpA-like peptidoglycan-associated protein